MTILDNFYASGAYSNTSAQTDIFVMANPIGLRTVNQGFAAFPGGVTTAVVTHGLGVTPDLAGIMLTPASNGAPGGTTSWWVTGITSTQFTINLNANTSGFNVSWRAAARSE